MDHPKRGIAIIFNHEHFSINHLKERTGTNVDCENLKATLASLGFTIQVYENYTSKQLGNVLQEGIKRNMKKYMKKNIQTNL